MLPDRSLAECFIPTTASLCLWSHLYTDALKALLSIAAPRVQLIEECHLSARGVGPVRRPQLCPAAALISNLLACRHDFLHALSLLSTA